MPTIDKIFSLEITPEKFIKHCSDNEIQELALLLDKEWIKRKIGQEKPIKETPKLIDTLK